MLNGPKNIIKTFLEANPEPFSVNSNVTKKRKFDESQLGSTNQRDTEKRIIDNELRSSPKTRNALRDPLKPRLPFDRFIKYIRDSRLDASSGRKFNDMLEEQKSKGRPLIIAKCLCSKHGQESAEKNKFLHDEFIDGNLVYETTEAKKYGLSVASGDAPDKSTEQMRKSVEDFMRRDYEIWAVNPLRMTNDVISNRITITKEKTVLDTAVEKLLSCDVKPLSEEDDTDQSYAYVIAGLYHSGVLVSKDEELATKSVDLLKGSNLPFCQAEALKMSLDVDTRVFRSLIALGVDPRASDEQGWTLIDTVKVKLSGKRQEEALDILRQYKYL